MKLRLPLLLTAAVMACYASFCQKALAYDLDADTVLQFASLEELLAGTNSETVNANGGTLQWTADANIMEWLPNLTGTSVILDTQNHDVTLGGADVSLGSPDMTLTKTGWGSLELQNTILSPVNLIIEEGSVALSGGGGANGIVKGKVTIRDGAKLSLVANDAMGWNGAANVVTKMVIEEGGILECGASRGQSFSYMSLDMTGGLLTGLEGSRFNIYKDTVFNIKASGTSSVIEKVRMELRTVDAAHDNIFNVERWSGGGDDYYDLVISSQIVSYNNLSHETYAFIKRGAGVMTLIGANTFATNTRIEEGTMMIGNGGTSGTLGSAAAKVNISNTGTLVFNRQDQLIAGNTLSGSGTIEQWGVGDTLLSGDISAFQGRIVIKNGSLTIGGGTTSAIGSGDIVNDSTLAFDRAGTYTITNNISGNGNVVYAGGGHFTLTGTNTYTGHTEIRTGSTVAILGTSAASALPSGTSLTLSGGTLEFTGGASAQTVSIGGLALADNTQSGLTLNGSGGNLTLNTGAITESGSLLISEIGTGSLSLQTTTNADIDESRFIYLVGGQYYSAQYESLTGLITRSSSTLGELAPSGNDSDQNYVNSANLTLTESASIAGLYASNVSGNITLNIGGNNLTVRDNITYTGTGNNTYTISGSGKVSANGFISSGSFIQGVDMEIGTFKTTGSWEISDGKTLSLNGTGTHTMNGTLTGTGTIDLSGTSLLELRSDSSGYSGTINLHAGASLSFIDSALDGAKLHFDGGTLQWATGNTQDIASLLTASTGTSLTLDTNGNNVTLQGTEEIKLAGDAETAVELRKTGTGKLDLNNRILNSINLVIEGGTVAVTAAGGSVGTIKGSVTIKDQSRLELAGNDCMGWGNASSVVSKMVLEQGATLAFTSTVNQGLSYMNVEMTGATITGNDGSQFNLYRDTSINVKAAPVSSRIEKAVLFLRLVDAEHDNVFTVERWEDGGSDFYDLIVSSSMRSYQATDLDSDFAFVKKGAGVMALNGDNTFTSKVRIEEGTLMIGTGGTTGTLGDARALVTIQSGGKLAFNRSDDLVIANTIQGDGTIEKLLDNNITLSGDNTGFGGQIIVKSGQLTAGSATAFGNGNITLKDGSVDLASYDHSGNITIERGNLLHAENKTGGSVTINQSFLGNIDLGGLNAARLQSVKLALPQAGGSDSVSTITGISGALNLSSQTTLGISSSMIADDNSGGTDGSVFQFDGAGSVSMSGLTLVLTDVAATKLLDAAGLKKQYIHLANVGTTINGTVNFQSPYHIFDYLYQPVQSSGNGWVQFDLAAQNSGRLLIQSGDTFSIQSPNDYGFDKFTGITNLGTINVSLSNAGDVLVLKDLEGPNATAVINTSSSVQGSTITLADNGNSSQMNGLYQGSIKGNSNIVKAGADAYNLTINGTIETPNLHVQNGKLIMGGKVMIARDAKVDNGSTLGINGSDAKIANQLTVDGTLELGQGAGLSVNTMSGSGPVFMDNATLTIGTVGVLASKFNGSGTLSIMNGNLTFGTGALDEQIILNLATEAASFDLDKTNDSKNIIGGLAGNGTLNMNEGILQIKGNGGEFNGSFAQNGNDPGTIDYSGAGTQTFKGEGSQHLNLIQSGSGKMVLNHSAAIQYNDINVTGGTLEVGNSMTANQVEIQNGSMDLLNNLTVEKLTIGNEGVVRLISPDNDTVRRSSSFQPTIITGGLTLSDGYLITSLSSGQTGNDKQALITSTGPVTESISGSFKFDISGTGNVSDWYEATYQIKLIEAPDSLTKGKYSFTLNDLLSNLGYRVSDVNYANGITVTLFSEGKNQLLQYADSDNTTQAADLLWASRGNSEAGGMIDNMLTSLVGSGATAQEITSSLASFAGSSATALLGSTKDELYQQVRSIRNRATQMGLNESYQYNDLPYLNSWIQGNGGWNRLDQDGDKAGYNLDTWGGTFGFDVNVSQPLTIGAAFTANHSKLKTKSYDYASGDNDALYANLFARWQRKNWTQIFILTGGWNSIDFDRSVQISGMDPVKSSGSTNGTSFGAFYETTYDIKLNSEKTSILQPLVNAGFYRTSIDSYTESGAGDASMHIAGMNATHGRLGMGARLLGIIGSSVLGREAFGELRLQAIQDIGDRTDTALLTPTGMPGSTMKVHGAKPGRTGIQIGAGLSLPMANQGSIYIDIDADFRSRATNVTGNLGYRYNF